MAEPATAPEPRLSGTLFMWRETAPGHLELTWADRTLRIEHRQSTGLDGYDWYATIARKGAPPGAILEAWWHVSRRDAQRWCASRILPATAPEHIQHVITKEGA